MDSADACLSGSCGVTIDLASPESCVPLLVQHVERDRDNPRGRGNPARAKPLRALGSKIVPNIAGQSGAV